MNPLNNLSEMKDSPAFSSEMTVRGRGSASAEAGAWWFVGVRSRRGGRLRGSGGVEPGRPRPCRLHWPRTAPIPTSGPPLPMRQGSLRPLLTGSPEMLRGGAGAADAQDVVAGPLLVEMCISHSRTTVGTGRCQGVVAPLMMVSSISVGVCPFKTSRGRRLSWSWTARTWKLIQRAPACISGKRYYDGPLP